MQLRHTAHRQPVSADPGNVSATGLQEVTQVDDLRLLCRIVDDGLALTEGRRHEHVRRAQHGATEVPAEINRAATHRPRRVDVAADEVQLGADPLEPLEVQVDGAMPEHAPAGIADDRPTTLGPQRAEEAERRTHRAHEVIRGLYLPILDHLYPQRAIVLPTRDDPEVAEHEQHAVDVLQVRDALKDHRSIDHQTSR